MPCRAARAGGPVQDRPPPPPPAHTHRHTHTRTLALLSHAPENTPVSLLVGLQHPISAKQKEAFLVRALFCMEVVVVIMVVNP